MSRPVPAPPQVIPSGQGGPCAKCGKATLRYGVGGNPLCPSCRAVREAEVAAQKGARSGSSAGV
ncbi:hypothetical protein ABT160_24485 [Streptomyces sp. NPDC001941]|uniref:hypothetical protein n=1 Tax=Streptomyces sp. NPDC001941 TaxID=3154659 RepID=UPI00331CBD40